MIALTDRARDHLERYLDEVRRVAAAGGDVDADDVVAGVREHVEAELADEDPGAPITAERLDQVLERLGTPGRWEGEPRNAGAEAAQPREAHTALIAVIALGLVGLLLATFERPVPGIALLAAGGAVARVALMAGDRASSELGELVLRTYWTLTALAVLVLLLAAPAVAVWSSAQIGGFLDGLANPSAPPIPGTRDPSYWRWITGLVAASTAAWWTVLGLAGVKWRPFANRLVGPALVQLSAASVRGLIACGVFLILPSLWMLLT